MFQQNIFKYGILAILFAILLSAMLNKEASSNVYQKNAADRFIGKKLDFSNMLDQNGNAFTPQFPALIHVFTSYCKYCKNDIVLFNKLGDRSKYRIYGLIWSDKFGDVSSFIAKNPDDYDSVIFSNAPNIFIELGVRGIPLTLVVGKDSEILYYRAHSLSWDDLNNDVLTKLID